MIKNILTWDLGATKCTAGLIQYNTVSKSLNCHKHFSIKLAETTTLEDLIAKIETGLGCSMAKADAICIGAAGQYDGKSLYLEGVYPYPMNFAEIANKQQWPHFAVIHDYASIVCATFTSYIHESNNIKRLNASDIKPYGRRVALGIGTGLGLKDGVLLENGDFWLGKNEVGHIGIPTPPRIDTFYSQRHQEFMQFLQKNSSLNNNHPITFEKILSGQGTVRLFQFFYPQNNEISPEEVGAQIRAGKADEMLDAFAWYIGLFVGTVQLSFMPEGGTWITGGVAINHLDVFDRPDFIKGIESSPAYLSLRQEYPLGVLCNPQHALIGSGYYAVKRLSF